MNVYFLLFTISSLVTAIPLGSLNGFLNFTEINNCITKITNHYKSFSVSDEEKVLEHIHFKNRTGVVHRLRKMTVLVIGGFYSGTPLSAFQVLHLADKIGSKALIGDPTITSLLKSHEFYFIPVLNTKAYQFMETHLTGSGFPIIKTGLEGNDLNCTSADVGINAYFNFPEYFLGSEPSCSDENPGTEPLQSVISSVLYDWFIKFRGPDLVINFQGSGKNYIRPPGNVLNVLNENSERFYEAIKVPQGYRLESKYDLVQENVTGSFLDFASKTSVSVEIALDTQVSNSSNIYVKCDTNYQPFLDLIIRHFPHPEFTELLWNVQECDSLTCNFSSYLVFTIFGSNSGYSNYKFTLHFDPGFQSTDEFTVVNISSSTSQGSLLNLLFEISPMSHILKVSDSIPGYNNYSLKIVYKKKNQTDFYDFHSFANIVSDELYINDFLLEIYYRAPQKRSPVIVGWILIATTFLLFLTAAGILKMTKPGQLLGNQTEDVKPSQTKTHT